MEVGSIRECIDERTSKPAGKLEGINFVCFFMNFSLSNILTKYCKIDVFLKKICCWIFFLRISCSKSHKIPRYTFFMYRFKPLNTLFFLVMTIEIFNIVEKKGMFYQKITQFSLYFFSSLDIYFYNRATINPDWGNHQVSWGFLMFLHWPGVKIWQHSIP